MPYDRDYTTDIELDAGQGCIEAPAVFSTWTNHADDLPTLTLETVMLGGLQLNREQVEAWIGKSELERIEAHYVPERWSPERNSDWDDGEAA